MVKIYSPEIIVKKITVGVPQSVAHSGSNSIHSMTGVNTTARENGHILIWDSSDNKYVTSKIVDGTGIETLWHHDSDTLIIGVNGLTTTNVSEGTNLYYTDARVDSNINNTGAAFIDNVKITFGNDSDLKIYHNESQSIIEDAGTGSLQLRSNNLTVQNAAGTENQLTALSGGAVTLYHNNNSKLATTIYGATVTGTINADSATLTNLTADSATITNINRSGTTVTPGIYGTAIKIPRLTIDSSGFIDSAGTVDVAGVSSVSFDSATYNYTINTADGGVFNQMIHTRKPGLAAGTHGSATLIPTVTVNQYGLVDSVGTVSVAGVSSTAWDSATGVFTISTADGNAFATTVIMDSDWTKNRVRSSLSASGDLTYDSNTGQFSFDVEDVYTKANFDSDFNASLDSAVTAGAGLKFSHEANGIYIDSAELEAYYKPDIRGYISHSDAGGDGSFSYNNTTGVFTYTGPSASETRAHFSASNSLSYSSSTGDFRLPQPLDSAANPTFNQLRGPAEFLIDPAAIGDSTGTVRILGNLRVDGVQTTINSTAVSVADKNIIIADSATDSAGLNGGGFTWGGNDIVDNPTFTYSHSDARLVSNRNIQATTFVGQISDISNHSTTNLSEGNNLYYTTARADSDAKNAVSVNNTGGLHYGSLAYNDSTGVFTYTGPSSAEIRAHFSAVDSGGDGAFSYEQATGKFKYRGPSATEVRSHFSGQGDISYDSGTGVFSLDVETVYTSDNFDSDLLSAGYDDLDHSLLVDSSVAIGTNGSLKPIDWYSSTTYRSSKYLIQATQGSKYQVSEILLTHDGSTPHITEYGKICIGDSSLATYDARITGGDVILEAQPVIAGTTFKYHRTVIKV